MDGKLSDSCCTLDNAARYITHSEEEREFPAVESHPEELWLQTLLLHNVVIICRFHFLIAQAAKGIRSE